MRGPPGTRETMPQALRRRRWLGVAGILLAFFVYVRMVHRPAHRDLPIEYSSHALARMSQRHISPDEVELTIRQGHWRPGKGPRRFESELAVRSPHGPAFARRLRVVFALQGDHVTVITVMTVMPTASGSQAAIASLPGPF